MGIQVAFCSMRNCKTFQFRVYHFNLFHFVSFIAEGGNQGSRDGADIEYRAFCITVSYWGLKFCTVYGVSCLVLYGFGAGRTRLVLC